jgi:hypothetical protein
MTTPLGDDENDKDYEEDAEDDSDSGEDSEDSKDDANEQDNPARMDRRYQELRTFNGEISVLHSDGADLYIDKKKK